MVRRRSVLGAVAAAGVAAALPAAPAQAATRNTVTVDVSSGLGPFPFRLGGQLSATPKSWRYGEQTNAALAALRHERVRVWLKYMDMTNGYDAAHPYLDFYRDLGRTLLLNWQSGYDTFAAAPGFDVEAFVVAQTEALAHFKERYPSIEYIEVENEDFGPGESVADYYRKYVVMYRAVNAVNDRGLKGPRLLVGGPTLDIWSDLRMGQFLDAYKADRRGDKRLDFISYHQYLISTSGSGDWTEIKDNPKIVWDESERITSMLRARGLPFPLPVFVSEAGIFPMTRASDLGFEADLHIQAAGMASLHYWYAGQTGVVPFDWTIDHPENDRKDLFVDTATGVPRPYYNALRMLSMLPGQRVEAISDALGSRGTGVYGLAAADDRTIAVMTWNYQWTGRNAYDSRVVISNFPSAFRTAPVRVTRYRIANDVHAGSLSPVETFTIAPRTAEPYYGQAYPLGPNELRLLVFDVPSTTR